MKTWRLVSGILSIILCMFVLFQSCAAGAYNALVDNGEISGSAGAFVALLLLAGGITSIATRNSGRGGNIAVIILFGLGSLIGFLFAGSYSDLNIWAGWCLINALLGIVALIKKPEAVVSRPAPSPRPAQPKPFTLTSRDLARTDGMMAYCATFGFQCGASADLCRFLFSAAEKEAASDGQVMTAFMALNDYQSAASNSGFCAVVFAASKVIVSCSGGCDVFPGNGIISFRSEPCDSKTVILMEHQGGVCRFGVDSSKAGGILEVCKKSLEDCKKVILENLSSSQDVVKKIDMFPKRLDGAPIYKVYILDVSPAPGVDLVHDVLRGEERILNVRSNGSKIDLLYNGSVIGTVDNQKRAEMLSDWEKKELPVHGILLSTGKLNLRFYKDKRKGNDFRDQNVVALSSYKSEDSQFSISLLENGDELDIEDDLDSDNVFYVTYDGDQIGKLPKKICEKLSDEGCYGVFFERGDEGDDGIVKPFVRIYW